jgi:uncharacterized protein DUF3175
MARAPATSSPSARTAKRKPATRKKRPTTAKKSAARAATQRRPATPSRRATPNRRWSHHVMETSDALDLESNVFARGSARQVALSLKRSAERSRRRKSTPYRSAMSMLNFYINRGGRNLSATRRRVLERAKDELRAAFGRS